jgi:flagellar basal-body rod protein FlgF
MIYGLYLSAQGAETQAFRQTVLANNMANSGTTAFKPDIPLFRAHFPHDVIHLNQNNIPESIERQTGGVELVGTTTDHRQGPLNVTQAPFDVAIVGPGFLQVQKGNQTLLTRNGHMAQDINGQIVSADDGAPILSTDGQPIVIPNDVQRITVAGDGLVSGLTFAGNSIPLGQLAVVEPANYAALIKHGDSHYTAANVQPAVAAQVRQGVLEESVTNPVDGMVELIQTARAFEMNVNMMKNQDEMLGQLIQSVPRR